MLGIIKKYFTDKRNIYIAYLKVFTVSLCCNCLNTFAQVPEMSFRYFSKTDGLLGSNALDIIQDSIGYIWIATNNGLNKFDGTSFIHFTPDPNDSTSIISGRISKIFVDSKGTIWISTNNGLCTYNNEQNNFKHIASPQHQNGLENNDIRDVSERSNGNIFVLANDIVYEYHSDLNAFSKYYTIKKDYANCIFFDLKDNLWIGSQHTGLIKISGNDNLPVYYIKNSARGSINNNSIYDIVEWKGKIWVATMGGGINVLNPDTDKFTSLPIYSPDEAYCNFLYVDQKNQLWSVDFTGLKFFNETENRLFGYYPDENNPYSIKNSVKGIFQDTKGNYWTYFEPGGIAISTVPHGIKNINAYTNSYWALSDPKILCIQEDKNGSLWMGNASNGVDVFNWSENKIEQYRYDPNDPNSLGQGATQYILCDHDNNIWVSNYHSGLQLYNERTNNFISFPHDPNDTSSIASNDIRCIYHSRNGDLLLAVHGKGVDRFDINTKTAFHYSNESHGLSNDWTYDIIEDSEGNMWVATAWGLSLLPKGENRFKFYFSNQEDSTSLTDSHILCLLEDSQYNIWIGTFSGLNLYNKKEDNFIQFDEGFESKYICSILEDASRNIWVSTNEGISKLNYTTGSIINFDFNEGIRAGEFYPRSAYNNNQNALFFGGINGVDIINAAELVDNSTAPKVIINSLKLFNQEITSKTNPEILQKHISKSRTIKLKHKQNVLSIGFTAINHINPGKTRYAYKLENFDEKWNFVGNKREAIYTNLNPKKYLFNVIATNNDNVWTETSTTLEIIILPPWYKTILFKIFTVLLTLALILLIIALRTSQLKKIQQMLQQKIKEKTTELLEKNKLLVDQSNNLKEAYSLLIERQNLLEEQSEEIKNQSQNLENANKELHKLNSTKDKLFSIIAHDLTGPFNTIIGFSDLLAQSYEGMDDSEKKQLIDIINQSSVRVFSLLQNLLLWARSQTKRISYIPENINVMSIIDDTLNLQKAIYVQKEIGIVVNCPESLKFYGDIDMTKTIFRNIFSNAIKFTSRKGNIKIRAAKENELVKVSVIDSGLGMSQDIIDNILCLDPVSPGVGTEGEKGSGLGLTICKDFLAMSKGNLDISSTPGKGSVFTFSLPISRKNIKN